MSAVTHRITIDPAKPLADQPETGHNRWHEDIDPILEVDPGETIVLETRDAFDGQLTPDSTGRDAANLQFGRVHPLTGPVRVRGAEPGDLLEVTLLAVDCDPWDHRGYTAEVPGIGFLRDQFPDAFLAHWQLKGDYAESPEIPGIRIPAGPFPGVIGVAPSRDLRLEIMAREANLVERGGEAVMPNAIDAVPSREPLASEGLTTIAPREFGGNVDIKRLTAGGSVFLPVYVQGALFSAGDLHFAQGDCQACGTAIEVRGALTLQFAIHERAALRRGIHALQFARDDYFSSPQRAVPRRCYATTGMSVREDGVNETEDVALAARRALLAMIDYLMGRGYNEQQSYAICSVAVDLHVSQLVNVPNATVTAVIPLDIFE